MKTDKPQVFIAHSFYLNENDLERIKRYRELIDVVFPPMKYKVVYGDKTSFKRDDNFFGQIVEIIRKSNYGIFDLTEYDPEKLALNLNGLLETGIGIGADIECFVIVPREHLLIFKKTISNFGGRNIRDYIKDDADDLKRVFSEIELRIDDREDSKKAEMGKRHIVYKILGLFYPKK